MEEELLVRRSQAGDLGAFEALFSRYAQKVYRTAYLICGDWAAAEDVMQEAFLQTFSALDQLRTPRAFSSWLYRTTVRLAQRRSIREQAERSLPNRLEPDPSHSPQDSAELRHVLLEAIQQLPMPQRTAVVLHYYQDRPLREVAEIMDVPEGTVKSWLHRAKSALAAKVGDPLPLWGGD